MSPLHLRNKKKYAYIVTYYFNAFRLELPFAVFSSVPGLDITDDFQIRQIYKMCVQN